MRDLELDTMEV
jgi:hypothetical protein